MSLHDSAIASKNGGSRLTIGGLHMERHPCRPDNMILKVG